VRKEFNQFGQRGGAFWNVGVAGNFDREGLCSPMGPRGFLHPLGKTGKGER